MLQHVYENWGTRSRFPIFSHCLTVKSRTEFVVLSAVLRGTEVFS